MDGNGKKPRPAPATDATQQPAARAALETPALCDDKAAAAQQVVDDGQPDVASVDENRGAEEEDNRDDDDDEQVERFYALLANIRAMRGLSSPHNMVASSSCTAGTDTDTAGAGDGSTRTKKRLRRSAEPPWRPVFRMEDFEEPAPPASSCKLRKLTTGAGHDDHGESSEGSARPTTSVAVVTSSSSSSMPHAAVRLQQSDSSS